MNLVPSTGKFEHVCDRLIYQDGYVCWTIMWTTWTAFECHTVEVVRLNWFTALKCWLASFLAIAAVPLVHSESQCSQ